MKIKISLLKQHDYLVYLCKVIFSFEFKKNKSEKLESIWKFLKKSVVSNSSWKYGICWGFTFFSVPQPPTVANIYFFTFKKLWNRFQTFHRQKRNRNKGKQPKIWSNLDIRKVDQIKQILAENTILFLPKTFSFLWKQYCALMKISSSIQLQILNLSQKNMIWE